MKVHLCKIKEESGFGFQFGFVLALEKLGIGFALRKDKKVGFGFAFGFALRNLL